MLTILALVFALAAPPATLAEPVEVLVLRSGEVIAVEGEIRVEGDKAIFRGASGRLYSIAVDEIDFEATAERAERARDAVVERRRGFAVSEEEKERLLREIEKNRAGKPHVVPPSTLPAPSPAPLATTIDVVDRQEEWYWRERAQAHEERVRRARENLEMIVQREQRLEDEILGLIGLGWQSHQFSHQVWQLEVARNSIEPAQLELQRAERTLAQFRDNARRQGIPPGWLR